MAVAGLHNVSSAFGPSFFSDSRPATRASALLQMWRELENEHIVARSCGPSQRQRNGSDMEFSSSSENGSEDGSSVLSDDLGETERERVRHIFREWMSSGSKGRFRNIEDVREGLSADCRVEVGFRPIRRLCGRQTLLDLVLRAQAEREREISVLNERRPVSEFPHRNRIQALLRGRFLRNERVLGDERPSSRGAAELGLLRQRHTVSNLREGFLSKLENLASTSTDSADSNNCAPESTCPEKEVIEVQTLPDLEATEADRNAQEQQVQATEADRNAQEQQVQATEADIRVSHIETSDKEDFLHGSQLASRQEDPTPNTEVQIHFDIDPPLEVEDVNFSTPVENYTAYSLENVDEELDSRQGSGQMEEEYRVSAAAYQSNPSQFDYDVEVQDDTVHEQHGGWQSNYLEEAIDSWLDMPSRPFDTFSLPDDDRAHSVELRELFGRRRVSTLLGSSFRERLNQVLQSHVERLHRASGDWVDQEQLFEGDHPNRSVSDADEHNQFDPSSDLFGGSHQLWGDEEFQGMSWSHHHPNAQLETEWEVINELRIDMARLQQRMNHMQSMLEACMEMQIELQRSVRQELSATLNRPTFPTDASMESQWDHVRKGICCMCRDSKIDVLLYRCGHMCLCSKCAENLVRCEGKCPMCEATVVEAVEAYFTSATHN
ncbi:RING/U-box superfamily protein [Striga hermonthica]|uniref:RING/U-box superfamily protein n=1 Tax=Striga hermonthica TaxID=68872 RepID=A0A9N7MRS6_STRHE|nr:RING/U-box superfamily protein [Striga hermonthica]